MPELPDGSKILCANPDCGHRQYWHNGGVGAGACTRADCPCKAFVLPENPDETAHDLSEQEVAALAKEMVSSIRKVQVIFTDHKGTVIWEVQGDILPGEEMTIKAPTPDDVRVTS